MKIRCIFYCFLHPIALKHIFTTDNNTSESTSDTVIAESSTISNVSTAMPENSTNGTNHTRIAGWLTDVNLCKLSHLGLDYTGMIGKSESGVRCQSWTAKNAIHRVDPSFVDDNFSDFSRILAKHYCRNPNREKGGPWCYTMDPDNIWETCGIPLCSYSECRLSGPGMEYAGSISKSAKGNRCLRWNKSRPKVKVGNEIKSIDEYKNNLFPDETVRDAKKFCRNPDGDIGGPWCFVDSAQKKVVEKQYCDIPFCHDETCMVFTKDHSLYSHYMSFSKDLINFTFGIKVWDPDSYLNASARLVLSLYALPITSKQLDKLAIGVEISISNKKTAVTAGGQDVEYEETHGILKANKYVYFSVTWWHNIITLSFEGHTKPILMADLKNKETLMNYKMNQFFYYSAVGNNILWMFPFCDIEDHCDVHTTTHGNFQKFFPLREAVQGQDLNFNIRTHHSAYILLVASPSVNYPHFKIMIQRADNFTRVIYKEHENAPDEVIRELFADNILKYWKWQDFTITLFGDEFELYTIKRGMPHTLISFKHDQVKLMRWFSPSSDNAVAHWTFFCFPPSEADPPAAFLPECTISRNEIFYNGTQDVTSKGAPCLPWAGQKIMPTEIDALFTSLDEKLKANNYCRDPKNEQKGAFCYILEFSQEPTIKKEYCGIRRCKSAECKMAGTGNDYIGRLSTTRANRTCQHWLSPAQLKSLQAEAKNMSTQNTTIPVNITAPNVTLSKHALEKRLRSINQYFENTFCPDKWKCLRDLIGSPKTKKSPKDFDDADKYINEAKHPPHEKEMAQLGRMAQNASINKMFKEEEEETPQYDYPYVHNVSKFYLDETLYADMNLLGIKNYCRNPTRDVAGLWCYTTDPKVKRDVCYIRDCDKQDECIVIIMGGENGGRKTFILPQWKEAGHHGGLQFSIKQWNPDYMSSFTFDFYPLESFSNQSMRLVIGDDGNERITFYYNGELVKVKVFPHMISTGKWDSLWVQVRQGEIMLGFEGIPTPFFEWKHDNSSGAFNPMFLNYFSLTYPIGVFFGCDNCHLENVTTNRVTKYYPIGLWQEEKAWHGSINIKVRGTGTILIPLMQMPNVPERYVLHVGTKGGILELHRKVPGAQGVVAVGDNKNFQITTHNWTSLNINIAGKQLTVTTDNDQHLLLFLGWTDLMYYYFSVTVEKGWVTWFANCDPMDIDGPPIDGGWSKWSPWVCTVTCGGGQGYRTRNCSNPRPNIFGKLCEGPPTSTGRCNEFQCGDVSPTTLDIVRQHLRNNYTSLVVMEGESVVIENDADLLSKISTESPDAYYEWTLDGLFLEPEIGRVEFSGDNVIIHKAAVNDTGVYVSMLFRINKERVVIRIVSLAVTTKSYRIDTRATRKATLRSHAVVLGYVYTDLRQKWTLNDKVYIDYGITTLAAVNYEDIFPLNESHTGEWRCTIEQKDLKFKWVTNIVKMNVKKAPTIYTNLMEDHLTAPLFAWLKTEANVRLALILLVVVVVALVAAGAYAFLKLGTLPPQAKPLQKKHKKRNRRYN